MAAREGSTKGGCKGRFGRCALQQAGMMMAHKQTAFKQTETGGNLVQTEDSKGGAQRSLSKKKEERKGSGLCTALCAGRAALCMGGRGWRRSGFLLLVNVPGCLPEQTCTTRVRSRGPCTHAAWLARQAQHPHSPGKLWGICLTCVSAPHPPPALRQAPLGPSGTAA